MAALANYCIPWHHLQIRSGDGGSAALVEKGSKDAESHSKTFLKSQWGNMKCNPVPRFPKIWVVQCQYQFNPREYRLIDLTASNYRILVISRIAIKKMWTSLECFSLVLDSILIKVLWIKPVGTELSGKKYKMCNLSSKSFIWKRGQAIQPWADVNHSCSVSTWGIMRHTAQWEEVLLGAGRTTVTAEGRTLVMGKTTQEQLSGDSCTQWRTGKLRSKMLHL